jgi:hypothetical protein
MNRIVTRFCAVAHAGIECTKSRISRRGADQRADCATTWQVSVCAGLIRSVLPRANRASGEKEMTNKTDEFARYSLAEKQLCDEAGPLLSQLIQKIERDHDVTINEFRVTIERAKPDAAWGDVTCTIVR